MTTTGIMLIDAIDILARDNNIKINKISSNPHGEGL